MQSLDWDEEYVTIVNADESMQNTALKRQTQQDELHAAFKAASRTLEAARSSSTRPKAVPSAEQHAVAMNELQTQRISLAKEISDWEGSLANKEAELSALKDAAKSLQETDPVREHAKDLDGDVLRLRLLKELGVEPCLEDGKLDRILVRTQSNDVRVVDWDSSKRQFDQCQKLWQILAE